MPVLRKPGLESADAEEARANRVGSATASRGVSDGAGCHAADAGDAAEAARTEEEEITPEMIEAGARVIADHFGEAMDWMTRDLAVESYLAMRRVWVMPKRQ